MQLTLLPPSHVQINNKSNKNRSIQPKRVCEFARMTGIPVKDQRSNYGGQGWFRLAPSKLLY